MIDLHCHVLPGIDDGPRTVEAALDLARGQAASRVRVVAATPHVTAQLPNQAAAIAADVARMNDALAAAGIGVEVVTGGEVDLAYAAVLPDEELRALTLGGRGWLLLEAPLDQRAGVADAVRAVARRGHRILLAHPERCPAFQKDPDALATLVREEGVRAQLTATALTGSYGGTVERAALDLVHAGLCHVIASDAHSTRRRPPGLISEIVAVGLDAYAAAWTQDHPAAILAGGDVPAGPAGTVPATHRKRGFLRRR